MAADGVGMDIEFLKMQGCGDDTLVVDCFKQPAPAEGRMADLARRILDRTRGVGANSLLVLAAGSRSRLSARSFTAGGEESPASCNALRCAARYAADSGAALGGEFPIETPTGDVRVAIIDSMNVRIDMGIPMRGELGREIKEEPLESFTRAIVVDGKSITYTPISLGPSFGIVFLPVFDFPFRSTGRKIAGHPEFPEGTGVGFARVYSREEIRLRVWETRGSQGGGPRGAARSPGIEGKANCCAAAAAVVASVVNGFTDREVFVHLAGGDVFLQWEEGNNRLFLTGPAFYVFTGTYYFEEEES